MPFLEEEMLSVSSRPFTVLTLKNILEQRQLLCLQVMLNCEVGDREHGLPTAPLNWGAERELGGKSLTRAAMAGSLGPC